ncbi:MAG: hypothetical protein HKO59_11715 [Phycisphaerales bacterium]|nr:hypothetical protein [Phycisphaerae bacterium]NNF41525.1 hypothetical protein [Phycisphaerales bacterium]NNM26630.1 hypothetical protein [Phycisphaerales bacterium]
MRTRTPMRFRGRMILIGGLLAGLCVSLSVGQGMIIPPVSVGDAFIAEFLRRDLHTIEEHLDLDDDQAIIAEALFNDYESAFQEGAAAAREKLAEFQPPARNDAAFEAARERMRNETRSLLEQARKESQRARSADQRRRIMQKYQDQIRALRDELRRDRALGTPGAEYIEVMRRKSIALEAWERERAQLGNSFRLNMQAILSEDQQALWPALERRFRREKTLHRGRLSMESLNLFVVAVNVEVDPTLQPVLDDLLAEYDLRLDNALKMRNDYEGTARAEQRTAAGSDNVTPIRASARRMMNLRVAVRNINQEYATLIESVLPPEIARRFRHEVNQRAFPGIEQPTSAQRAINAAKRLDDITDEALIAIDRIEEEFRQQLALRNEELRALLLRHEPDRERVRFEHAAGIRDESGQTRDDPITQGFRDRHEFGGRYVEQLRSVLTPQQFATLPGVGRPAIKSKSRRQTTKPSGASKADLMGQFDKNGDGRLDERERDALRAHIIAEQRKGGG